MPAEEEVLDLFPRVVSRAAQFAASALLIVVTEEPCSPPCVGGSIGKHPQAGVTTISPFPFFVVTAVYKPFFAGDKLPFVELLATDGHPTNPMLNEPILLLTQHWSTQYRRVSVFAFVKRRPQLTHGLLMLGEDFLWQLV